MASFQGLALQNLVAWPASGRWPRRQRLEPPPVEDRRRLRLGATPAARPPGRGVLRRRRPPRRGRGRSWRPRPAVAHGTQSQSAWSLGAGAPRAEFDPKRYSAWPVAEAEAGRGRSGSFGQSKFRSRHSLRYGATAALDPKRKSVVRREPNPFEPSVTKFTPYRRLACAHRSRSR